ncbi:hypothetical protein J7M22_08550 [Candidatus Poribacteria bacterium]|nr:hypothetical protein [Candidatus Poribacteria bacterium]
MDLKSEMAKLLGKPIYLAPNTFLHFYNGGKLRAEFMGEPDPKDDYRSEEWIFSTNRAITPGRDNPPDKGISRIELPSGRIILLTQLLEAFPDETIGRKHYEKYGPKVAILVKIFDVGDGAHIPVHWHPSPEFAQKHLNSPNGKNEAWVVIGTRPGVKAWIGWKREITKEKFRELMEAQDVEGMRSYMHEITPKVDDVYFLRDSIVHSLGSGICNLEPQEPTDWNILAEWEGFPYDKEDAHLGLGWDLALEAADFSVMDEDYLYGYVMRTPELMRGQSGAKEEKLVPEEARKYFFLTKVTVPPGGRLEMPDDRGFYCAVTTKGEGEIKGPFGEFPIKRGKSVFITATLPGYDFVNTCDRTLEVICCYPPPAD